MISTEQIRNQLIYDGLGGYATDQHVRLQEWIAKWLNELAPPKHRGGYAGTEQQ